jgi:hypothetical protein
MMDGTIFLSPCFEAVDGRDKPGHDNSKEAAFLTP